MPDTTPPQLSPALVTDRADQLILHLLRHPADLIDMRRVMQSFQASAAEVQQALGWLEQHRPPDEEESQE